VGFSRLIWFDRRGTGLSDPAPGPWTLEDGVEDVRAVMDAVGAHRATLFGVAIGAATGTAFALRHPERTRRLVLWGAHARLLADADYPAGWTTEFFARVRSGIDREWASGYGIEAMNPSLAGDVRFRSWFARHARAAASPRQVGELFDVCAATDLRSRLPQVSVPTLVLHRDNDPWLSVGHSRYVAAKIPGATLVEFPGVDHWPWVGDAEAVLTEVEEFVTGVRRRRHRAASGPDALTGRERTVAELAVQGLSAREIARRLHIGERTAETHISHVYGKLGVGSRLELVLQARELGL
jgi:pimeloyl-ACP methyl ester carboxylesterase